MFTYLIDNLTNTLFSKDYGYCYVKPTFKPESYTNNDLFSMENKTLVFSEIDIPKNDLRFWGWDGSSLYHLSEQEQQSILNQETQTANRVAMQLAIYEALKQDILVMAFDSLSTQHKKIIAGIPFEQFTDEDWAALGI